MHEWTAFYYAGLPPFDCRILALSPVQCYADFTKHLFIQQEESV